MSPEFRLSGDHIKEAIDTMDASGLYSTGLTYPGAPQALSVDMSGIAPSHEVNRLRFQFEGHDQSVVELDASGHGATLVGKVMVDVQLHDPIRVPGEWKRRSIRRLGNSRRHTNPNIEWVHRGPII